MPQFDAIATLREAQVAELLMNGLRQCEIARTLKLSGSRVSNICHSIECKIRQAKKTTAYLELLEECDRSFPWMKKSDSQRRFWWTPEADF